MKRPILRLPCVAAAAARADVPIGRLTLPRRGRRVLWAALPGLVALVGAVFAMPVSAAPGQSSDLRLAALWQTNGTVYAVAASTAASEARLRKPTSSNEPPR